jgi:hypothetical protein
MPRIDPAASELAFKILKRKKIFTLSTLVSILDCSSRAAQTKLKFWKTHTSFNQNGKYYALPEIPCFNSHGLWRHDNVAFSMHGNLKKTIIYLTTASSAGLSGKQLGKILGLNPQSFLHHFRKCPGIHREKHDGVYVYFADETSVYKRQLQERRSIIRRSVPIAVSDVEAVLILVAVIKHHGISAENILALPEIKKSKIKLEAIQGFLEFHGLVKKNQDSSL